MPLKFKSIREGQQALIYNHLGEGRILTGPQRVFLFRKEFVPLKRFTASQYQYLEIKNIDGVVSHLPGPCAVFHDPLSYEKISVCDAIMLDANQQIVVYKRKKNNSMDRKVVAGPSVFIPTADEWCHEFVWHGQDPVQLGHMIPDQDKFTKLPSTPQHFYYNVRDVRTNDDILITVKIMLFYELKDIIKMLEQTKDPIGDLINALCADVIYAVGKLSFSDFLKKTASFSDMENYPRLIQRGERVGYQINNVIYRGYHSSNQLQSMQDNAIQSRTKLRLDAEAAEQNQTLIDFKLQKEQARLQLRQDLEHKKQNHELKVIRLTKELAMLLDEKRHESAMKTQDMTAVLQLECDKSDYEEQLAFTQELKNYGVDLTKYLVSQQQPKITEEIQVQSSKTK